MSPGVFLRPADSLHVWNGKRLPQRHIRIIRDRRYLT